MANFAGFDDFDGDTDGDLNGQGGGTGWSANWSGSTDFDIQGTVVRPGGSTKAVKVAGAAVSSEGNIVRVLTAAADAGDVYFSNRKDGWAGGILMTQFRSGGTLGFYVLWELTSQEVKLIGTTTEVISGSILEDTWYDFNVNWVTSTTVRARMKLSTDTDWGAFTTAVTVSNSLTSIDRIRFEVGSGNTNPDMYWDLVEGTAAPAAGGGVNRGLALMGVGQ